MARKTTPTELETQVQDLLVVAAQLRAEIDALETVESLRHTIEALEDDIAGLKRERAGLEDTLKLARQDHKEVLDRRERETEHKLGLLRDKQTQDAELAVARQRAELDRANLEHEKALFEREMTFRTERWTEEVGYLKDMVQQVLANTTLSVEKTQGA